MGETSETPIQIIEKQTSEMDDIDTEALLKVNSAIAIEKEIAADALGEIFVNVREAFLPYLQTATEQLLELADTFYEGSRKSALSSLWKFVVTLGEIQITEPWQPGLPVVCESFVQWLSTENPSA